MLVFRSTFLKQKALLDQAYADLDERDITVSEQSRTIKSMADTIRNMDQLIYRMSQCTSWPAMQPWFAQLQAGQESRQRAESDRITDLMRTELISVYAPKE